MNRVHIILYVEDQERSTTFYRRLLQQEPDLDVPGMTEFHLADDIVLGLMPTRNIRALLGSQLPDPDQAAGVPRAELYLVQDDPEESLRRAVQEGARLLSPVTPRDWGHRAGYCLDPDGHVLAFAEVMA